MEIEPKKPWYKRRSAPVVITLAFLHALFKLDLLVLFAIFLIHAYIEKMNI